MKQVTALSLVATSQFDAAETLGVHVRTFANWLKRGCPGEPRAYVIRDCIEWAKENVWSEEATLIEGATGDDDDIKTQYLRERIEKIRRENTLADFKIETQNERLVDADEVKALLTQQANVIRAALEKLERKYGSDALDIVLEVFDELDTLDFTHPVD